MTSLDNLSIPHEFVIVIHADTPRHDPITILEVNCATEPYYEHVQSTILKATTENQRYLSTTGRTVYATVELRYYSNMGGG